MAHNLIDNKFTKEPTTKMIETCLDKAALRDAPSFGEARTTTNTGVNVSFDRGRRGRHPSNLAPRSFGVNTESTLQLQSQVSPMASLIPG